MEVWACLKPEPAIGVQFSWVTALNPEPQVQCGFRGFLNQPMASLLPIMEGEWLSALEQALAEMQAKDAYIQHKLDFLIYHLTTPKQSEFP